MTEIARRVIDPAPAQDSDNARWLWALQDARARTKAKVKGLTVEQLDFLPSGLQNSIGTLLYHIALIEADYLCIDVLGRPVYLPELQAILPLPDRDRDGCLSVVTGLKLDEHLTRLDVVRSMTMEIFSGFTREQLDAPRLMADWGYEITPAWTIHHLIQDETEHRGEIGTLITLFQASTSPK